MTKLALLFTLLFSFTIYAVQTPENCPCKSEVQKFCADTKDYSEHKPCLEKHHPDLSKECQDHLKICDCQKDCPMKKGEKKNCKKQCPMKKKVENKE